MLASHFANYRNCDSYIFDRGSTRFPRESVFMNSLDFRGRNITRFVDPDRNEYVQPVHVVEVGDRLQVSFPYSKAIIPEIKSMEGARWNPNVKEWSVANSRRNWFQLAFLAGESAIAKR